MEDIFKKIGFEVNTIDGSSKKALTMFNLEKYNGVTVKLNHDKQNYQLICGNIKFFGNIIFPEMSIKRSIDDIIMQLKTAKYYHDLTETYKPW